MRHLIRLNSTALLDSLQRSGIRRSRVMDAVGRGPPDYNLVFLPWQQHFRRSLSSLFHPPRLLFLHLLVLLVSLFRQKNQCVFNTHYPPELGEKNQFTYVSRFKTFFFCNFEKKILISKSLYLPQSATASRNDKVENVGGSTWIRPAPSHVKSKVVNTTHPVKDGNTLGFTHCRKSRARHHG